MTSLLQALFGDQENDHIFEKEIEKADEHRNYQILKLALIYQVLVFITEVRLVVDNVFTFCFLRAIALIIAEAMAVKRRVFVELGHGSAECQRCLILEHVFGVVICEITIHLRWKLFVCAMLVLVHIDKHRSDRS